MKRPGDVGSSKLHGGPGVDDDRALFLQPQDLQGCKRRQWRQLRYVGGALPVEVHFLREILGPRGKIVGQQVDEFFARSREQRVI